MGVILFKFEDDVIILAEGGIKKMARLFFSSLTALVSLANLAGACVHFVKLDEDAWNDYVMHGEAVFSELTFSPPSITCTKEMD